MNAPCPTTTSTATTSTATVIPEKRLSPLTGKIGRERCTEPTRRLICTGLCALVFLYTGHAWANPWTRDQGHVYTSLSYSFIRADRFYTPDFGTDDLEDTYQQHTLGLYAEIGLIDHWLTGVIDMTLFRRSQLDNQGATQGVGDFRLGLWSGIIRAPFHLSTGILLGIPTGDPVPLAAEPLQQLSANSLPTGDGEWDVEFALAAGKSYKWRIIDQYIVARMGYWLRTTPRDQAFGDPGDFPDAFNWTLESGLHCNWPGVDRLWLIGRLFGSESFQSGKGMAPASGLGGGITHRSFGLELFIRIWKGMGASVGVSGAFAARSLPAGAQYRVALTHEY